MGLRRRQPIRRTALRRGTSQLTRAPIAPRCVPTPRSKPLRSVSPKRRRQLNLEAKLKAELIDERGGGCEAAVLLTDVACWGPIDKHEIVTRARGGDPLDRSNVVLICRAHHNWVDLHPIQATQLGLLATT